MEKSMFKDTYSMLDRAVSNSATRAQAAYMRMQSAYEEFIWAQNEFKYFSNEHAKAKRDLDAFVKEFSNERQNEACNSRRCSNE